MLFRKKTYYVALWFFDALILAGLWFVVTHFNRDDRYLALGWCLVFIGGIGTLALFHFGRR